MISKIPFCRLIVFFSILLICVNAADAGAVSVSEISDWQGICIVQKGQLLVDINNELDLAQLQQTDESWITPHSDALNFGYSKAAYWVRWTLSNDTNQTADLIIDLGNPREDHVTWYTIRKADKIKTYTTGDRHPFQQRPYALSRNFALPLSLAVQETITVYVHLQSHDGFFEPMPVTLNYEQNFLKKLNQHTLILTLYHGGLFFLLLYNLLLFFSTKERGFLIYTGYLFCLAMWNLTVNGFSFQYLWPESPKFNNHFLTFCSAYAFGLFGLFTIEYLNLRQKGLHRLTRGIQILSLLNFIVIIPSVLDYYAFSVAYGQIVGVIMMVVTLGTGIRMLIKGQRQARFFMAAFTMLGVGATVYILKIIGWAPTNLFTTWALQFGSTFEVLILALGLADSMNILKQEKLDAERQAREAQETLAIGLEQQVRQRTQELESANRKLKSLAITDELTGAYNRRHFNTICSAAFHQKQRNEPLAFCMFDIDYFKRFNDTYGHAAGDDALQKVSSAILNVLKRSGDVLFRLGGEEFGVLYTTNSKTNAVDFAEKMRNTVLELGILHKESPEGFVTASFGVSYWDTSEKVSPDQVYTETDVALYLSKDTGRNKVTLK